MDALRTTRPSQTHLASKQGQDGVVHSVDLLQVLADIRRDEL